MATTTTNYGFSLPAVNDPTDEDLWGNELNANTSSLDALLKTATDCVHVTITGNTAIDNTYRNKIVLCDATAGAFVPTLQAAAIAGDGFSVTFKKIDSSSNAVTVTATGVELIDTVTTYVVSSQDDAVTLVCNGTLWYVKNNKATLPSGFVKAIRRQVFTLSATYTPSAGMLYCDVEILGGGGGGGGSNGAAAAGGGGGAGAYCKKVISAATIGANQSVTIGAAGTAGSTTGTNGGAGGNSTFGAILAANGGNGGTGNTNGSTAAVIGATGGTATGGDLNITGQNGDPGFVANTGVFVSGTGANSIYGTGGAAKVGNSAQGGNNASGYASGGGGSLQVSSAGGVGAAGLCIVTEYCSQ